MTIQAFTGGAGCGKTYQLMLSLVNHVERYPLQDGQKVLALTYMHGSRRRLEERLGNLTLLRGRTECSTLDSFSWRLVRRWRSLSASLGFADIEPDQYEKVCDAAGTLLQNKAVRGWVAATFPILLLDEAQDLTLNRLRLIQGLSSRMVVFAAADEFQCLKEDLRPNPACTWLTQIGHTIELTVPQRTNNTALIDAATAIRNGDAPQSQKEFRIELTPKPSLAGAWLAGNLHFYGGKKSVAVITPTFGYFAKSTLKWTAENTTKKGSGPYSIPWEESEAKAAASLIANIEFSTLYDIPTVTNYLVAAGDIRVTREVAAWMDKQRRTRAQTIFSRTEIEKAIENVFSQRRRAQKIDGGWKAITVHGAKNREFDNVIILWPAATMGSDDQKRRLLYNAVTRAKERCLVLVQTKAVLGQAPFA